MRGWLALVGLILGLLIAAVFTFVLWRFIYLPAGCWRWDPGSAWRAPANCESLGGILKLVEGLLFIGAFFVPVVILGRKKS